MKALSKEIAAFDFNGASWFAHQVVSDVDNEVEEQIGSDVAALPVSDKPPARGTFSKRVRFQEKNAAE